MKQDEQDEHGRRVPMIYTRVLEMPKGPSGWLQGPRPMLASLLYTPDGHSLDSSEDRVRWLARSWRGCVGQPVRWR